MRKVWVWMVAALAAAVLGACGTAAEDRGETAAALERETEQAAASEWETAVASERELGQSGETETVVGEAAKESGLLEVPVYDGEPYAEVNGNVPFFAEEEITDVPFETYGELDELGRCREAAACVGTELMPTEERGMIGQVKPSGWHTVKYDVVADRYLYHRCHLIGYQLTGENANERNLITGTQYMNVTGMMPFENQVADYVRRTGNHVMYRVTPVFLGENLVASGVLMEAESVEDNGEGILFCVFVFNVQPGVVIDYATGESALKETEADGTQEITYILNKNTKKFHNPSCDSVPTIKAKNKEEFFGTREEALAAGYAPCGQCKP